HGRRHGVEREFGHHTAHHPAGTVRRSLMVGLPKPDDMPVGITDLENPPLDPVHFLDPGRLSTARADRGVHALDVVDVEEDDSRSGWAALPGEIRRAIVLAEANPRAP